MVPAVQKQKKVYSTMKTWKTVKGHHKVELVRVNCEGTDEEKALAKANNVQAYPTVVIR